MRPRDTYTDRSGAAAWREWSRVVHGPGFEETKRRYWASRWTPKRCFWHLGREGLQLNHLTYRFARRNNGITPLWTLVPLCARCHGIETWVSRKLRRRWAAPLRLGLGPHVAATLYGWLVLRGVPAAALFVGEAYVTGLFR